MPCRASSRKFTVRIACNGTDAVVVNGVLLDAQDAEIRSGRYTLDPLGESFLQGLWDLSQDTSRYFYNSSIPTVFIKNGGQVTFRLHFAPGGGGYTVFYQTQGAQATAEVSLDGKTWVPLKGERVDKAIDMSGTGTFFLRFSANDGETFLQTLTATREESEPPVQTNGQPERAPRMRTMFISSPAPPRKRNTCSVWASITRAILRAPTTA